LKVLLLNQAFWPDVVASAQQLAMLARRLTERGHQVTVITGARGYDDPATVFPRRERWNSIDVVRVASFNAGKQTRWRRMINFGSFSIACAARLLVTPRHDVVIALTSPPLISWLGSWFARVKGGELIFWPLDLNPDEAIAAGWLKQNSIAARFLARLLKRSMERARTIIALDEFMKQRIVAKGIASDKVDVIPPAPFDEVRFDQEGREAFRRAHGLEQKFVVMYAGNHSPCHPLDTLLAAAEELKARQDLLFLFVGGGSELQKVKSFARAQQLPNIRCLPYQPQAKLSAMLSAADLEVIVMGDEFSGIVHPSKIYNILKVGAPFLFIGPQASFVSDIANGAPAELITISVRHGETARIVKFISELIDSDTAERRIATRRVGQLFDDSGFAKFIGHIEAAASKEAAAACLENPQTSPDTI
jgi:putative colanic acid biosynthesis glycosyltransferase WcaI